MKVKEKGEKERMMTEGHSHVNVASLISATLHFIPILRQNMLMNHCREYQEFMIKILPINTWIGFKKINCKRKKNSSDKNRKKSKSKKKSSCKTTIHFMATVSLKWTTLKFWDNFCLNISLISPSIHPKVIKMKWQSCRKNSWKRWKITGLVGKKSKISKQLNCHKFLLSSF